MKQRDKGSTSFRFSARSLHLNTGAATAAGLDLAGRADAVVLCRVKVWNIKKKSSYRGDRSLRNAQKKTGSNLIC